MALKDTAKTFPLVLLLLTWTSAFGQVLSDKIVAVVEDEIILLSDLEDAVQLQLVISESREYIDEEELKKMYKDMLEVLINQKIIVAKAQRDTIVLDSEEVAETVEAEFESRGRNMTAEQFKEALAQENMTERDFRDKIEKLVVDAKLRDEVMYRLSANASVSRKEIQEFKETYKDSLPDNISISHILIRPGRSLEKKKKIRQRAEEILERARMDEDFEELAKKYSEDPGSSRRGGDLGFFERGKMIKEFEDAAFALSPGEISDIVETQVGYHIVKLEEKDKDKIRARHILFLTQVTQEDNKKALEHMKEIRKRAFDGEDFGELAMQFSDDHENADERGFLGYFPTRGDSPSPAFKAAIRKMRLGEISPPVMTELGFHIIKLNDEDDFISYSVRLKKIEKAYEEMLERERERLYIDIRLNEDDISLLQ